MDSAPNLPKYKRPPVIEVVCGVQFDPLPGFTSLHFGEFWHRIKENYPKAEDKPPLDDLREAAEGTQVKTDLVADIPPLRRVWYIDSSRNFLIQLQPSRFLSNWRKVRAEDEYPSYATAFDRFLNEWTGFLGFANDTGLSPIHTNQYELTYINHILEAEQPYPAGIARHLPLFSWESAQSSKFLPAPQSAALSFQFLVPEAKGRLHATISHGSRQSDKKGVLVIDLTARGAAKEDWSDMKEWFSMAHEWIVCGFTDLTSRESHQLWERER